MALLAKTLDKSLSEQLARVGSDPTGRFEAYKSTLERFLRSLPLSSNIVLLFKRLDKIVQGKVATAFPPLYVERISRAPCFFKVSRKYFII